MEFAKKQQEFAQHLKAYLMTGPMTMPEDAAMQTVQKFMQNVHRTVGSNNLEDLDELARDYLLKA